MKTVFRAGDENLLENMLKTIPVMQRYEEKEDVQYGVTMDFYDHIVVDEPDFAKYNDDGRIRGGCSPDGSSNEFKGYLDRQELHDNVVAYVARMLENNPNLTAEVKDNDKFCMTIKNDGKTAIEIYGTVWELDKDMINENKGEQENDEHDDR